MKQSLIFSLTLLAVCGGGALASTPKPFRTHLIEDGQKWSQRGLEVVAQLDAANRTAEARALELSVNNLGKALEQLAHATGHAEETSAEKQILSYEKQIQAKIAHAHPSGSNADLIKSLLAKAQVLEGNITTTLKSLEGQNKTETVEHLQIELQTLRNLTQDVQHPDASHGTLNDAKLKLFFLERTLSHELERIRTSDSTHPYRAKRSVTDDSLFENAKRVQAMIDEVKAAITATKDTNEKPKLDQVIQLETLMHGLMDKLKHYLAANLTDATIHRHYLKAERELRTVETTLTLICRDHLTKDLQIAKQDIFLNAQKYFDRINGELARLKAQNQSLSELDGIPARLATLKTVVDKLHTVSDDAGMKKLEDEFHKESDLIQWAVNSVISKFVLYGHLKTHFIELQTKEKHFIEELKKKNQTETVAMLEKEVAQIQSYIDKLATIRTSLEFNTIEHQLQVADYQLSKIIHDLEKNKPKV